VSGPVCVGFRVWGLGFRVWGLGPCSSIDQVIVSGPRSVR